MKRLVIAILLLGSVAFAFADSYAPATYNLQIQQGEDFAKTLVIQDGNKRAINLTGYGFAAQARQQPTTATFLNFSTVVNSSAGTVQLRAGRALTSALGSKTGYWDLLMTFPDGTRTYLLKGQVYIFPTVTR